MKEGWRRVVDRPALRAYEEWDPAGHFSGSGVEQLRCLLFASAEQLAHENILQSAAELCLDDLSELDL